MRLPDPEREKLRYLALAWGAMLGPATFRRLVAHFNSTRETLAASTAALSSPSLRLTPEQVAVIPALHMRLSDFETEAARLHADNISVLCVWEDGYPGLLREIRNPPPVVCVAGRLLAEDDPAIAIVGTRSPTEEGYEMARSLGQAFARENTTVVGGLARGCDTAAHTGALEGGGRTIAVLGSGIEVVRPRGNLALARQISQRGAVVSEQPPAMPPSVGRLMARNRLQSALSRGVLVVESLQRGGSMETARHALDQGCHLYAVKWPQGGEQAAGPEKLLMEGAIAVSGPESAASVRLELVDHIGRMMRRRAADQSQGTLFD